MEVADMSSAVLMVSAAIGFIGMFVSVMLSSTWIPVILIVVLAFAQNISFTIVSRSRNRDNLTYHLIASVFSNGVWFLTFKELISYQMDFILFVPYTVGTVAGSLMGQKISMFIEIKLGALSDSHIPSAKK